MALSREQVLKIARILALVGGILALLASPAALISGFNSATKVYQADANTRSDPNAGHSEMAIRGAIQAISTGWSYAWALLLGGWLLEEVALFRRQGRLSIKIVARVGLYLYVVAGGLILTLLYLLSLCHP